MRECWLTYRAVSLNMRKDVYCDVTAWCQLSFARSCLEKRMTCLIVWWQCRPCISIPFVCVSEEPWHSTFDVGMHKWCTNTTSLPARLEGFTIIFFSFFFDNTFVVLSCFTESLQVHLFCLSKKERLFYNCQFFVSFTNKIGKTQQHYRTNYVSFGVRPHMSLWVNDVF